MHHHKPRTRFQFCQIFRRAWMKGMTMVNIVAGFRTTGIYPLDRSVVSTRSVAESNLPVHPTLQPLLLDDQLLESPLSLLRKLLGMRPDGRKDTMFLMKDTRNG